MRRSCASQAWTAAKDPGVVETPGDCLIANDWQPARPIDNTANALATMIRLSMIADPTDF
jgi:hypothetical protein